MPTYRLCKLNEAGKYSSSELLEASDDDAAMIFARSAAHGWGCQVWLARRLVGSVSATRSDRI